jgi:hypothetical protein
MPDTDKVFLDEGDALSHDDAAAQSTVRIQAKPAGRGPGCTTISRDQGFIGLPANMLKTDMIPKPYTLPDERRFSREHLRMSAQSRSGHARGSQLCGAFDTRGLTVWKHNRRTVHEADVEPYGQLCSRPLHHYRTLENERVLPLASLLSSSHRFHRLQFVPPLSASSRPQIHACAFLFVWRCIERQAQVIRMARPAGNQTTCY